MNFIQKYLKHTETHLEPYDVMFSAKEFVVMKAYGLLVGLTTGTVFASITYIQNGILPTSVIIGTGFSILGYLMPNMWVKHLSKKRKKMLNEQMEETLVTIREKFEKEQDLMNAIKTVANEKSYPISHDLLRIYEENTSKETSLHSVEDVRNELKKRA